MWAWVDNRSVGVKLGASVALTVLVAQQNAAMVEQSTAACHSLSNEAKDLSQLTGRFKVAPGGPPGYAIAA